MRAFTFGLTCLCLALVAAAEQMRCPNLSGDIVCKRAGPGFSYTDGCNGMQCGSNGISLTTLAVCPVANGAEQLRKCQEMEEKVNSRLLESQQFSCPKLSMNIVCLGAPESFMYSDGCNYVTCDGKGSGSTTFMDCPPASTRQHHEVCDAKYKQIVKSMEVSCSLNTTEICQQHELNYRFSDGCNKMMCTESGAVTITRKMCPAAPSDCIACKAILAATKPKADARSSQRLEFSCKNLSPETVCSKERIGFSYSDGCNTVTCIRPHRAITTLRYCDPADDTSEYCKQVNKKLQLSLNSSSLHRRCLTAADVCKTKNSKLSFYDGCNYCMCLSDVGSAGCTRLPCRRFFGTDEQFKAECERRKAGIINRSED